MDSSAPSITDKRGPPQAPDWNTIALADTWPDQLNFRSWHGWRELLRAFLGKERRPVVLPEGGFALQAVPKYLLQEFHNLPNGNYSSRFSRGYITGFDIAMCGHMQIARGWIANRLHSCEQVLDVGTAGGRTAAAIKQAGVKRVWGLDPSPYLLRHAAKDHPHIEFIPGLAEDLPFADQSLDGIALCFVLHEIPPKYIQQALAEFARVLKPGGKLVIAEPSHEQLEPLHLRELLRTSGWSKLYFKVLAARVYEPFVDAWHKLDKPEILAAAGFTAIEALPGMPITRWAAQKSVQNTR
jgi:ubiquinone/menaquinone biosynthesis C-methylase UbiE